MHLYDLAALPESSEQKTELTPIAEYDTKGTRLTCLTMAEGDETAPANGKRKREGHDEDAEDDEDGGIDPQENGDGDSEEDESDEGSEE